MGGVNTQDSMFVKPTGCPGWTIISRSVESVPLLVGRWLRPVSPVIPKVWIEQLGEVMMRQLGSDKSVDAGQQNMSKPLLHKP